MNTKSHRFFLRLTKTSRFSCVNNLTSFDIFLFLRTLELFQDTGCAKGLVSQARITIAASIRSEGTIVSMFLDSLRSSIDHGLSVTRRNRGLILPLMALSPGHSDSPRRPATTGDRTLRVQATFQARAMPDHIFVEAGPQLRVHLRVPRVHTGDLRTYAPKSSHAWEIGCECPGRRKPETLVKQKTERKSVTTAQQTNAKDAKATMASGTPQSEARHTEFFLSCVPEGQRL